MAIPRYKPEHEDALIAALGKDLDWKALVCHSSVDKDKKSLLDSITYDCYENGGFVGYLRALHNDGSSVYISELFVIPEWRNRTIGRTPLAKIRAEFSGLKVYISSDEDAYYEKLGYTYVGSVFEVSEWVLVPISAATVLKLFGIATIDEGFRSGNPPVSSIAHLVE